MGSRRHIPASYEGRPVQAPGMIHHGPLPAGRHLVDSLPPEFLENKLAAQAAEIGQLSGDNHQLAATHIALREDLVAAQREADKLREHIRSIQNESDIQIRLLLDKIAKMEVDFRDGDSLKKDMQQALTEARSLAKAKQDLSAKIEKATQEVEKARADIKKLPEMRTELDSLRKEHQKLRKTFEYEKGLNIEKVEQLKITEKDLIRMAKEVERLRAEVINAEKRAQGVDPYGRPYMNPNPVYQAPSVPVTSYVDSYGRPYAPLGVGHMGGGMVPYGIGVAASAPVGVGTAAVHGNAAWGVGHDASEPGR